MTPTELKAWRTAKGWTQQRAAEMIGNPRYQSWQSWELGTTPIPAWLPRYLALYDAVGSDRHDAAWAEVRAFAERKMKE